MMTNKYDNAMDVRWSEKNHIDYKKFILPIAGGIVILIIVMLLGMR